MSEQYALIVRLPVGTEHWYVSHLPTVGEVIPHTGATYVVTSVEGTEDGRYAVMLAEQSSELNLGELPGTAPA
jgi:hypothetical protein